MAKLMSDGESSTESIILINTATSVGITNCTQLSKTWKCKREHRS